MDVIEMLKGLFFDQREQEKWNEDPEAYLEDKGATDLTVAQINEAAQLVNQPVDLGAEVNVGGNQTVGHVGDNNIDCEPEELAAFAESLDRELKSMAPAGEQAPGPYVAPPPPPAPAPSTPPVQQIEETINYYVTNVTETNVDDRDTYVDNSVGDIVNVGGTVDIDQETVVASGDGSVAAGENAEGVATGDGAVAAGDDIEAPVTTGDDNTVVDNSGGEGGDNGNGGDGGTVIIGDGNENNDVDIDFGEGGASGPVNVGVGSGDTSQDNHTEDNDGTDIDDHSQDNDGVDVDDSFQDNDGVDYDDQDGVDHDDQDLVDDKDLIDADLGFGAGRTVAPERARLVEEVAEKSAPEPEYTTDMGMPEEPQVVELAEAPEVVEIVEAPVEMAEILPDPEPEMATVGAEAEPVELVEE